MITAPYTIFGKTKLVPIEIYINGKKTEDEEWDCEIWIERGEDWYMFSSEEYTNKRVRIIKREIWLRCHEVNA